MGILGSFYEAFFNSVHIDIGIISYRPKLRNTVYRDINFGHIVQP